MKRRISSGVLSAWSIALVSAISSCSGNGGVDGQTEPNLPTSMGAGSDGGANSDAGANAQSCKPLTQWEQKMLDAHNRWRSTVSPPAANMQRVYWDTNIAKNAAKWVSSCDPQWPHSSEAMRTGIGGYSVLGENLSYCAGTGCKADPNITDGSGMGDGEGWWAERADYNYTTNQSSGVTSHYTQMVSSNIYAIGCATQKCGAPGPFGWNGTWWWTICQYGPRGQAYWSGTKPYDMGTGGIIEPPSAIFTMHPGLCR
ncbi:MAG TPA: CAP domain-containing protein [Pseudomonadota bacterium]|nr:CAP domain-containing protein [Pseudomonadota bacterium]HNN52774.1 CAP domain-containing protein [Pseudomonadota bacterium]